MSLLKKMAQVAARKAFLATIIGKAQADIKASIEQLCADPRTVDALQHYATHTAKQAGQFPLTPALVAAFDIADEMKELLTHDPAILSYLNQLLAQFQAS
ncbi:MAG: hypothetical protein R3Y56_02515 [Akkermansia sp.]